MQTVDFITPVVDDPFVYGQIAAANSLSDVFAMGGDVKTVLNVVGFDGCHHDKSILQEILRGGESKVLECGGSTIGGHTIETPEMYYGLSVTGVIHPQKIYRNNTARVGDVLILTKPLGLGVLTTAIKADLLSQKEAINAANIMATLNFKASKVMRRFNVSACTDITGFGFLGHASEMAGSKVSLSLQAKEIALLEEAKVQASMGIVPAGSYRNRDYLQEQVNMQTELSFEEEILLYDAQTSGGLLIAVSQEDASALLQNLQDEGSEMASIVGLVKERSTYALEVV